MRLTLRRRPGGVSFLEVLKDLVDSTYFRSGAALSEADFAQVVEVPSLDDAPAMIRATSYGSGLANGQQGGGTSTADDTQPVDVAFALKVMAPWLRVRLGALRERTATRKVRGRPQTSAPAAAAAVAERGRGSGGFSVFGVISTRFRNATTPASAPTLQGGTEEPWKPKAAKGIGETPPKHSKGSFSKGGWLSTKHTAAPVAADRECDGACAGGTCDGEGGRDCGGSCAGVADGAVAASLQPKHQLGSPPGAVTQSQLPAQPKSTRPSPELIKGGKQLDDKKKSRAPTIATQQANTRWLREREARKVANASAQKDIAHAEANVVAARTRVLHMFGFYGRAGRSMCSQTIQNCLACLLCLAQLALVGGASYFALVWVMDKYS